MLAFTYSVASDSRVMRLPTQFVMAKTRAPLLRARRTAARVSAVSPDWLMAMTSADELTIGLR